MRFAVIGSNGFVGSNLVRYLESLEHKVFNYTSKIPGLFDSLSGNLNPDFNFPVNLDAVFYLSQSPFYRDAEKYSSHLNNVNAFSAAMAARKAEMANAKAFFYTSSGNVYLPSFQPLTEHSALNPADIYANSKILGEELIRAEAKKMTVFCLRLFGVFGANQAEMRVTKVKNKIVQGEPIVINQNPVDPSDNGGIKISYLHVDDFLRIVSSLLWAHSVPKYNVLNIGGPKPVDLKSLSLLIANCLGREPIFEVSNQFRKGDLIADVKALKSFGFSQFTPIEVALSKTFFHLNPSALAQYGGAL